MKLFIIFLIFLVISFIHCKSHSKSAKNCPGKKRHHRLRGPLVQTPLIASDGLPSTPKAITLKNHFGANPSDSPYGPQPTLIRKLISTTYPDGSIKRENQTEIIHLPEGVFSECEIKTQKFYPLCFNLKTCDLCASNPHCGWCEATQKCLPGKVRAATCAKACFHSWIFNIGSCKNNVFGKMTNVAPDALDLITVEETEPKIKVDTIITHPAVVKTPVLLGKIVQKNEYKKVNMTSGDVIKTDTYNWEQPILGEVQQVMNVDTHHTQYIGLNSGKRLDEDHPRKVTHGRENFAFKQIEDNEENSDGLENNNENIEDFSNENDSDTLDYSQEN